MTRRRWGLLALGVAVAGWIIGGEWVSIRQHVPENHLIDALGGLSFLVAGVVALDRRPHNRIGWLMIAYAVVSYLGNWGNLQAAVVPMIGLIGQQLGEPILAQMVLSYPTGRLRTRFERFVIGTIWAAAIGVAAVIAVAFAPRADGCARCAWEPAAFPDKNAVMTALLASQRAGFFVLLLFLAAVWLRWRRATPAERRDLAPLWVAVCVYVLVGLMGAFASPDTTGQPFAYLVWELQSVLQIGLPVVFVWGLLSARLARSAVGDLVLELDRPLLPGELRACLARTLGDPSLEVLYAREGLDGWVDGDGQPGSLPEAAIGQQASTVTVVERDGQPLAALIHDPALDQGLVRAAAAAAGMAIENERLQAEVRAQLEEVRASRQRIVEAGDAERRRVERNLHDGAQQRMATLALALALLRDRAGGDAAMAASLDQAAAELRQAIAELRELARGIHPAILTEEGLPAAVEALADRSSLPVGVRADFDERLPGPVEATAYFVVSESLANVTKHARASGARVELSRCAGTLRVEVTDDGVGGADASRGSGLRGLQDRVAAVRGSFHVENLPAGGTRVLGEIPCDASAATGRRAGEGARNAAIW
jgi:signal transduction histidine kinase